jgi:hypothetical protein
MSVNFSEKEEIILGGARTTRLMTGANSHYLTQEGISLKNYVWLYCMKQAIGQASVGAILRGVIKKIEIIFRLFQVYFKSNSP